MKKRILLALLFLLLPASAWATTPVTGNVKNLGGGSANSGLFVRFWLRGCQGAQPRVNGVALIAPSQGAVFYQDFVADANGNISGTVYSTRSITGNGNGEIECPSSVFTAVWYGVQLFFAGKGGPEVPVAAKNGATLDVTTATPLNANPVITAPTGDSTYARLDGGNQPFSGSITAPNVTATTLVKGSQVQSTIATGTAPLVVASTTVVPNLNAQLHNGLTAPASAIVGISDTQALTGKTLDISANTLKNSSNTAGHVPRNNGTQYVDGQVGFADVTGTASTSQIGTGTPAASKYVDGGTGAWTALPTTGVQEAPLTFQGAGFGTGGIAEQTFLKTLLPQAHTVTRFTVAVLVQGVTCGTAPVVALWDATAGSALTSLTIANSTAFFDSGVISVATTAGHQIDTKVTTANSGCGTQPTIGMVTAILSP